MLDLGIRNTTEGWQGVIHMGEAVVWVDPKHWESSPQARQSANQHAVEVFRAIFSLEATGNGVVEFLQLVDPRWLQQEAINREEPGGKLFIENVLEILLERAHAS
jgi:hypothetical protein